jgi:TorA maturation chaperone TorD
VTSGGPGPLLLSLAVADPATDGPRAAAYLSGFLARILLDPPSEELLSVLGRPIDPPRHRGGVGARAAALARLLREEEPVALAREWTRLFVGPRNAPCRPWHDTWECEGPPRLMGPKHASMLALYRRTGLEPARFENEPADHAGLVLALFSALAARAASGEDARAPLEELWRTHVSSWLPRFAATLVAEARIPSLRAAGELLGDAVGAPPA